VSGHRIPQFQRRLDHLWHFAIQSFRRYSIIEGEVSLFAVFARQQLVGPFRLNAAR
jgi:hypothetical protein